MYPTVIENIYRRATTLPPLLAITMLLTACSFDPIDIKLASGWSAKSIAVWRHTRPDMIVASRDHHYIYISCENRASLTSPSLYLYSMKSGRSTLLISGLDRADALKTAPDGSLWIGEEVDNGLIWRITNPERLPAELIVQRATMRTPNPALAPLSRAGQFAHEGIAFSHDGEYAYLPDEHRHGSLYRYQIKPPHLLEVAGNNHHWQTIIDPLQARTAALKLNALQFNRMEDAETLPNGHILIAETDAPRIIEVIDHGATVEIREYLNDPRIHHPDNLAWDESRHILWITDDDKPSILWAWDGRQLEQIALHRDAEITGVLPFEGDILINLQGRKNGPELTLRLHETLPQ
ncbi:MAG: hypothetical protein Q9M13_09610 [Mariprofundales bacterium]|nr:hypothetical protein [Mariprofundales bacterium]